MINASFPEIVRRLGGASIGLNTMKDEHFGISVVEFMVSPHGVCFSVVVDTSGSIWVGCDFGCRDRCGNGESGEERRRYKRMGERGGTLIFRFFFLGDGP